MEKSVWRTNGHGFATFILKSDGTLTGSAPTTLRMWVETETRRPSDSTAGAGVFRRHFCPSEEHGGAVGGSSTKMEQNAPEPHRKMKRDFESLTRTYS